MTKTIGTLPAPTWNSPWPVVNNDPAGTMFSSLLYQGMVNAGATSTLVADPSKAPRYMTTDNGDETQVAWVAPVLAGVGSIVAALGGGYIWGRTDDEEKPNAGHGLLTVGALLLVGYLILRKG